MDKDFALTCPRFADGDESRRRTSLQDTDKSLSLKGNGLGSDSSQKYDKTRGSRQSSFQFFRRAACCIVHLEQPGNLVHLAYNLQFCLPAQQRLPWKSPQPNGVETRLASASPIHNLRDRISSRGVALPLHWWWAAKDRHVEARSQSGATPDPLHQPPRGVWTSSHK